MPSRRLDSISCTHPAVRWMWTAVRGLLNASPSTCSPTHGLHDLVANSQAAGEHMHNTRTCTLVDVEPFLVCGMQPAPAPTDTFWRAFDALSLGSCQVHVRYVLGNLNDESHKYLSLSSVTTIVQPPSLVHHTCITNPYLPSIRGQDGMPSPRRISSSRLTHTPTGRLPQGSATGREVSKVSNSGSSLFTNVTFYD